MTDVHPPDQLHRMREGVGQAGSGPLARVPPPDRGLRPVFQRGRPAVARGPLARPLQRLRVRAAVDRSLPGLQRIDIPFIKKTGCVSCHHNTVVSMAVDAATRNGYRVDDRLVAEQRRIIADYLGVMARADASEHSDCRRHRHGQLPVARARAAGQPPDAATDAQAIWLRRRHCPTAVGRCRPSARPSNPTISK